MVEKAFSLAPGDPDLAIELGYQMALMGRTKEALKWYKTSTSNKEEASISALTGNLSRLML